MGKRNRGSNLVLINASLELKKRLQLESIKRGKSISEMGLEILDANLPQYEEFTVIDNGKNGHSETETLRKQFEKASQS